MPERLKMYLCGYLQIQLTGYSPERFLNLCKHKDIYIWDLTSINHSYVMYITVKGFRKLKPLLRKTKCRVIILERYGVPFFLHKYRKRKIFFLGAALCVLLILNLSRYIWEIDIEGNQRITEEMIVEYLKAEDVYHGMKRKNVACEKIATEMRKDFNEIKWVSASLDGSKLMIHLKENEDLFQVSQLEEGASDIVANQEGIITQMIVRSGSPCVKIGDYVQKGDILVTGSIEVKNDAGETVRVESCSADADLYAEVTISYNDICEMSYEEKELTDNKKRTLFLNVFGRTFLLGNQKYNCDSWEIRSYTENIKLNQQIHLPITYGEKRAAKYILIEKERSEEEMKQILKHNLENYCEELEEDQVILLESNVTFQKEKQGIRAKGTLKVLTPIGTECKRIDF